jgi:hypothetical protein
MAEENREGLDSTRFREALAKLGELSDPALRADALKELVSGEFFGAQASATPDQSYDARYREAAEKLVEVSDPVLRVQALKGLINAGHFGTQASAALERLEYARVMIGSGNLPPEDRAAHFRVMLKLAGSRTQSGQKPISSLRGKVGTCVAEAVKKVRNFRRH